MLKYLCILWLLIPSIGKCNDGFLYRVGSQVYLNAKPYRTIGINSFAMMRCTKKNDMTDDELDYFFSKLPKSSLVRFFIQAGQLNYIRRIVDVARKHSQKLVVVLTDGLGGCGDTAKTEEWFTKTYKVSYLQFVSFIVAIYKENTTIAIWEIINEPATKNIEVLRYFLNDVSTRIRLIDKNHLISSGALAPYTYGGVNGYIYIHDLKNIDIISFHEYDQDSVESPHFKGVLEVSKKLNKPIMIGEFGIAASYTGDAKYKTTNGGGCYSFEERAKVVKRKIDNYLKYDNVFAIMYWSYFPKFFNMLGCRYETYSNDPLFNSVLTESIQ